MDDIGNIVLETIRVSIPEFIRLVFAGMAGGVIGAYANDKLTRRREADRDQRLKDEAAAAERKAVENALRLTPEQKDILRHCASERATMKGYVMILGVSGFGSWIRAGGNKDFMDQKDPSFQARYLDAFSGLAGLGYFRRESEKTFCMTGAGYDRAKNDT